MQTFTPPSGPVNELARKIASEAGPAEKAEAAEHVKELAEKAPFYDGKVHGRAPKFKQGERVIVTGTVKDPEPGKGGACHGARAEVYGTPIERENGEVKQTVVLEDGSVAAVPEEKLSRPAPRKSFSIPYRPGQYEAIFGHG